MGRKRRGSGTLYLSEVVAGTLMTTDGRPVIAVSTYAAQPSDGRPLLTASLTTPADGSPIHAASFYAAGTLATPDGRPVYAVTAASGGGGGTLDTNLSTPTLILTSADPDGTDPVFDMLWSTSYAVGDTLRLYQRNAAGTIIATFTDEISLAEATDTSAGTDGRVTLNLSTVAAGTWRWDFDVLKAGGLTYGPLSNRLTVGPDDVAPTITSANPSGTYPEITAITGTLTANETVTFGKTGTNAADVTLNTSTGAWSYTPDFETVPNPSWSFTATDAAGNVGTQAVSLTITDVAEDVFSLAETAAPASASVGYALPTATWTGVDIGAASASREIIILTDTWDGNVRLATGVTVNGIAATLLGGNFTQSMWRVSVPTGTTATIVVTAQGNLDYANIKVWRGTALGVATVHTAAGYSFRSSDTTISVNTPAGGATLVYGWVELTGRTASYTNATLSSQTTATGRSLSSAIRTTSGTDTVTMTHSGGGTGTNLLAVSIAP